MTRLTVIVILVAAIATVCGHIVLPAHLSSGAVLQTWRGYHTAAQLYGTADPGELVCVTCSAPDVPLYTAVADATGHWDIAYNWPPGPSDWNDFTLTFNGSATPAPIILTGVRWGDVVLCLGDGAALLPVRLALNGSGWATERNVVSALSDVRLFPATTSPSGSCAWGASSALPCNTWTNASGWAVVGGFSSLCLQTVVEAILAPGFGGNRVVGIVQLAANASAVEDWLPPGAASALASCPALSGGPAQPGQLWQPTFALLVARYYVVALGTSDAPRLAATPRLAGAQAYACRLKALVDGLRAGPQIGDAPVLLLEPALGVSDESLFALRLAVSLLLTAQPEPLRLCAVALGVAVDTGDAVVADNVGNLVPINTLPVAQRAAAALVYSAWWSFERGALGPVAVSKSNSTSIAFLFAPGSTLSASTLHLMPAAPNCTACCDTASAAFQLSASVDGDAWVDAVAVVGAGNVTLTLTATSNNGSFLWARYGAAPAAAPQCILVDAVTLLPAPAFLVAIQPLSGTSHSPATENSFNHRPLTPKSPLPLDTHEPQVPLALNDLDARRKYLLRGTARAQAWARGEVTYAGLAATPPLYFSTWQAFRCNLNEDLLRRVGQVLVSSGLAAAGYTSVNMDDCEWRTLRGNTTGAVLPDETRFPSGMASLVELLANQTVPLTLGVYTSQTSSTCTGRPGSFEKEDIDAATYCAWGAQYVKVDRCGGTSYPAINTSWINLRAGLDKHCPYPVLLSVESCGVPSGGSGAPASCAAWIRSVGAQMWRTTSDLQLFWASIMFNLDNNEPMAPLAGPGGWNDPDMLVVGHPGLSSAESRSHIAAWAVSAAPLGLSLDVVHGALTTDTLALLLAPEVLAVDQDPAGVQGVRATAPNATGSECWARPLAAGGGDASAVLLFNRAPFAAAVTCTWAVVAPHFPPGTRATVRDLWARSDLGVFAGGFTTAVLAPHDSMLVKVTPVAGA